MSLIENHFDKFHKNIKLTKKQREDAQTKYSGVCKTLHKHYYKNEYTGATKLLFGSYGKKTNIRPPRDVDVLFKMPESEYERYDNYESNGQSKLLQEVKEILNKTYTTTDDIKGWGKVIVVKFSEGAHNVEILPAWSLDNNNYKIPNSEHSGSWEEFDPVSDIERLNKSEEKTGMTKQLIQMIKKWDDNCSVAIISFEIEEFVLDFLSDYDCEEKTTSEIICAFFKYLQKKIDSRQKSHVETAIKRSAKAYEYEVAEKYDDAIDEWIKVFGADFPKTIKRMLKSSFAEMLSFLQNKYPSEKEEDLTIDYGIPVEIDDLYDFKIDVLIKQKGFRDHYLSDYIKHGWLLNKAKQLKFKVIKNNVPYPYDIKWKVRNYGEEAKHNLRGEISIDNGSESKIENTKYKGNHYVECYCIKDGRCVARDRLEVKIGAEKED